MELKSLNKIYSLEHQKESDSLNNQVGLSLKDLLLGKRGLLFLDLDQTTIETFFGQETEIQHLILELRLKGFNNIEIEDILMIYRYDNNIFSAQRFLDPRTPLILTELQRSNIEVVVLSNQPYPRLTSSLNFINAFLGEHKILGFSSFYNPKEHFIAELMKVFDNPVMLFDDLPLNLSKANSCGAIGIDAAIGWVELQNAVEAYVALGM